MAARRPARRLCLPVLAAAIAAGCSATPAPPDPADFPEPFTGSAACRDCHLEIHDRWQETLMANVLLDPRERPDAILGDFETPNPLVTFRPEDVTFTYGRKWKQRYFTRRGDDLFVFPAQWDVQNREWRRYERRRLSVTLLFVLVYGHASASVNCSVHNS